MRTTEQLNIRLRLELKRKFLSQAKLAGRSATEILTDWIEKFVERGEMPQGENSPVSVGDVPLAGWGEAIEQLEREEALIVLGLLNQRLLARNSLSTK